MACREPELSGRFMACREPELNGRFMACREPERSEWFMVGVRGFEPRTSSLSVKCSNQLSYTPLF